jgi:predicted dehydrogenase
MIRLGLIGAGPNGAGNVRNLLEHEGRCRLMAVADPNQAAAARVAAEYGGQAVTDYRDFLATVDAVVISSPNFLHAEQAVACAEAGKHVWIEKPMALSTADADRIVAAVQRAGVVSMVGFSVRFDAVQKRMREVLDAGTIGQVFSIWSRRMTWSDPAKRQGWRSSFAQSGGLMSEIVAHEIDWIVDVMGAPSSVHCRVASQLHDAPGANDHVWMTLGFGAEATGSIEASMMAQIADFYRGMVGDKGSLFTARWGQDLHLQTSRDKTEVLEAKTSFDKFGHFLDAIEGRCETVADANCGRRVVAITEKALESALSGQVVKI